MKQVAGRDPRGSATVTINGTGVVEIVAAGTVTTPPGVNAGIAGDPGGTIVTVGGPIIMTVPGAPADPGVVRDDNIGAAPEDTIAPGAVRPGPVAPPVLAAVGVALGVIGAAAGGAPGAVGVPPAPAPDVVTPPMVVDTMEDELTIAPLIDIG